MLPHLEEEKPEAGARVGFEFEAMRCVRERERRLVSNGFKKLEM